LILLLFPYYRKQEQKLSIPESHASDFPKRRLAGWNSFAYNEIRVKTLTEHFDRKEGVSE